MYEPQIKRLEAEHEILKWGHTLWTSSSPSVLRNIVSILSRDIVSCSCHVAMALKKNWASFCKHGRLYDRYIYKSCSRCSYSKEVQLFLHLSPAIFFHHHLPPLLLTGGLHLPHYWIHCCMEHLHPLPRTLEEHKPQKFAALVRNCWKMVSFLGRFMRIPDIHPQN